MFERLINILDKEDPHTNGSLYAVITAVLFATFGIFAKYIYEYNINSDMVFFFSSFISTFIMFFIVILKNKDLKSLRIKEKDFLLSFVAGGFLALFCVNVSVLKSLNYIDAGVQKVIAFSSPIFTTFIYVAFFRRKISKRESASLIVMLLGLLMIIGNMKIDNSFVVRGILLSIMAAIFNSLYSIITEEFKTKIDQNVYWFYAFLGATISSLVYIIFNHVETNIVSILTNFKLMLLLIASAIMNFVVPYITQFIAINSIGAIKSGVILTLSPVVCVILGIVMLGEKVTILQVIGMIFVVVASVTISQKNEKELKKIITKK